jgi:flavin-dependent dehydrogenase
VTFVPDFTAAHLTEAGGRTTGVVARDGRTVKARITVIAGGSHCTLLPTARPRRTIQAIMGWWEGVPFRDHTIEMIFDRSLHPLYGWLFPEGPGRVNIGITYEDAAGKRNARELFRKFLDTHYADRLTTGRQVGDLKGHPIVYSYRIDRLTAPGTMVIGEAGLLTHPATAEGIYQGMRSGMLAAESLRDVVLGGKDESAALAEYERRCRKTFHASFVGGGIFRALLSTPILDVLAIAGGIPFVRRAAAKILAAL